MTEGNFAKSTASMPFGTDGLLPEKSEQPPVKVHLAYLDSLRALAALYVVIFHATTCIPQAASSSWLLKIVAHIFAHGQFAVCVFIVLSGFCLMLPVARGDGYLRGGSWKFLQKRARRILPPYYLAFLLSLFLIWLCLHVKNQTSWDDAIPVTASGIITHFLLIQDLFQSTSRQIDYPLWSVSVEWRIYFVFPLLVLLWRSIGPIAATALSIAAGYGILVLLTPTFVNTGSLGVSPHFLGLFALGMLSAGIVFSGQSCLPTLRRVIPWSWTALILTLLMPLLLWRLKHLGESDSGWATGSVVGLWASVLLVAVSNSPDGWFHRGLSWRPLAFLGTFAYSIYLMHAPFLQLLWQYAFAPLHLRGVTATLAHLILVTAIVVFCYGFYLTCERPFLSRPVVISTE